MYIPYIPGDPRCETEVDRVGQIFAKVAVDSAGSAHASLDSCSLSRLLGKRWAEMARKAHTTHYECPDAYTPRAGWEPCRYGMSVLCYVAT